MGLPLASGRRKSPPPFGASPLSPEATSNDHQSYNFQSFSTFPCLLFRQQQPCRGLQGNEREIRTVFQERQGQSAYAQTQELDTLETIFEYNRDPKRIRALRLQVQDYEYRVKLRAQKLEQMRRLGEEIEGLE